MNWSAGFFLPGLLNSQKSSMAMVLPLTIFLRLLFFTCYFNRWYSFWFLSSFLVYAQPIAIIPILTILITVCAWQMTTFHREGWRQELKLKLKSISIDQFYMILHTFYRWKQGWLLVCLFIFKQTTLSHHLPKDFVSCKRRILLSLTVSSIPSSPAGKDWF